MAIITLLTDFGSSDAYVGVMKGVILSIAPEARIVDITHEVDAQDITAAAFVIDDYYRWFGPGTVHVAVVDPTVGSSRRPIIISHRDRFFVGPDNGLFSLVMGDEADIHLIGNPDFMCQPVSATFHGRDVFSPAAARLSLGISPESFGRAVTDPVRLQGLYPEVSGEVLTGRIVRFDRFGNGITNIPAGTLTPFIEGAPFTVEVGSLRFDAINRSYYEGTYTCLLGSSGYLEFGYFKGSFRAESGVAKGEGVRITRGLPTQP